MGRPSLPYYRRPPVVEAYCGIYFKDLQNLDAPHIGAFWAPIRKGFPLTQAHPNLPPLFMLEGAGRVFLQTTGGELPRTWFISQDQVFLIQLQKDRIFFNWRKSDSDSPYPRYQTRRRRFRSTLDTFISFLDREAIGSLEIVGVESGYINIFEFGRELQSIADIGHLFPSINFATAGTSVLSDLSHVNAIFEFKLPDERGKMTISIQKAAKPRDGSSVLKLDIFARWTAPEITQSDAFDWLDSAHVAIVKSFSEITNKNIQRDLWEKYR
jgi:uncharacterized protein (TIGR04255 family)